MLRTQPEAGHSIRVAKGFEGTHPFAGAGGAAEPAGNTWVYTGQTVQPRIGVTQQDHADGMTTFCVRDNGAGFDMAYAAQLFQPFKRLHDHHEFEGSGLGLATLARVVRRHGGQVRGEGAVGGGAAFYFSLPEVPVVSDLTTW